MDHPDNNTPNFDFQENTILEMMKEHISNGLPFHYTTNYADPLLQSNSDGEVSVHTEQEQDDNDQMPMAVAYKKRARIKFTQEQLDVLEMTFEQHRYPTIDIVDDLVEQLNLPTQKITNRRARLKKNQQKVEEHSTFERVDQQHYDSGIHLDDDTSRTSSTSPSSNLFPHIPPIGYFPPSPYYTPHSFYDPMWQNFRYPFPPPIPPVPNSSYDFVHYQPPFVFQEMNSSHHQTDFHG